ncbi:GNAT family N-acetyltransferase [Paenibacillus sp. GCM10027626]|uniref:GNAT family N-acetyltransferase n=1 Tax=Paenibacillus sp. GCM10027626 TaxID=3273411 RepID=UPI00364560A4
MTLIDIVPYHPDYAEKVAEMWNRSNDEWGGGTSVRSAEQVRQSEENSDAISVFLAICNQEVVGYCSLGEYRQDTGALYIQLLNVRPDFHGHKIGKRLVLQAIEETIRLGWPRVDLYTWEANMKAVPLYKRCGFFWEDREDAVHFMNFIPQVAACEALAPYFREFDWYADLKRTIEIKPDGQKVNGFETYTYAWEGDNGQSLRVDIERRSRGICLIETEDFLLSATAEQAEPVFGNDYKVKYRIVNKSGAPLKLEFQGESDRNITFDWQDELQVEGERQISASFFVGAIEEPQSEWRTCPAVQTRVRINGSEALLKVGIVPKFPASVKMSVPAVRHAIGGNYMLYLDMQNHFAQPAAFSFTLPGTAWLALEQQTFETRLQAKERVSLAVPYRLLDYGFYQARPQIRAVPDNGPEVLFTSTVGGAFGGPGAMAAGETDSGWMAWNGGRSLHYDKDHNEMSFRTVSRKDEEIMLLPPSIGKPYSSEFTRKKPLRVEICEERGAIGFRHTYRSDAFPQLLLHLCTLLYADGTVKLWHELENDSGAPVSHEVWISQRIRSDLYRLVLPYGGRILELTDSHGNDHEYWDSAKVSEPWLFARSGQTPFGICWSGSHRMRFGEWYLELESVVESLEPGETKAAETIFMSIGGFDDWNEFRAFALKLAEPETPPLPSRHIELTANEGNPFVPSDVHEVTVALHDVKQNVWEGELSVSYAGETRPAAQKVLSADEEAAEASFALPSPSSLCSVIQLDARLGPQQETYYSALFPVSSAPVRRSTFTEAEYTVYEADNGMIRISAAPDYYPALRSLAVQGQEWLASGFPEYGIRSWWNPWIGGLTDQFDGMSAASVRKEEHSASFVHIADDKGNVWSGIRIRQSIQQHETYKGTIVDSYYLLLPGAPVLAYMTDIRQNTGTYLEKSALSELFLRYDESGSFTENGESAAPGKSGDSGSFGESSEAGGGWLRTFAPDGKMLRYAIGKDELNVRETKNYAFGFEGRAGVMQIVTDETVNRPSLYTNKDICCLSFSRNVRLPHGNAFRSAPVFFVFSDALLPAEGLDALRRVSFPLILESNYMEGAQTE